MSLLASYTAAVERNQTWSGLFATEPYETAWAREGVFFVRALSVSQLRGVVEARVQISPDGIHWCDEGTRFSLPSAENEVTFARVSHFAGWLRITGEIPGGSEITVIVYLSLKS